MPTFAFNVKNEYEAGTDITAGQDLNAVFECRTDTADVTGADVIVALASAEGVYKGSPHPDYPYALCTTIRARKWPQDPFRFDVVATFREPRPVPGSEVNPGGGGAGGGQPSPPDRPPWVRGNFRREDRFQQTDLAGSTFKNSAGDLFTDPPAVPWGLGQFVITRWYDAIDYNVLRGYENKCNSAAWNSLPAHSLLIEGIDWEPHSVNAWAGWQVNFTITHRPIMPEQDDITNLADFTGGLVGGVVTGGWHPWPVLDVGFYYLDGSNKLVYDEPAGSKIPKSVPGFLDDGARSTNATYRGFDIYARISFAILD